MPLYSPPVVSAPTTGGVKTAAINVGDVPTVEAVATIMDPAVTAGVPVACQVSGEPSPGCRSDDVTIDSYQVFARAYDGHAEITLRCVGGMLMGVYKVNYMLGVV